MDGVWRRSHNIEYWIQDFIKVHSNVCPVYRKFMLLRKRDREINTILFYTSTLDNNVILHLIGTALDFVFLCPYIAFLGWLFGWSLFLLSLSLSVHMQQFLWQHICIHAKLKSSILANWLTMAWQQVTWVCMPWQTIPGYNTHTSDSLKITFLKTVAVSMVDG